MKKHLVIVVGAYKPYMSPNGKIMSLLAKEFSEAYQITVLTRKNHFGLCKMEILDDENIIRVDDLNEELHEYFTEQLKNGKRPIVLYKSLLQLKRAVYFVSRVCRSSSVSVAYCKKLKKALDGIDEKKKIDVILAVSAPHEEVHSAVDWGKQNNRNVFVFQMDRFVNANSLYPVGVLKSIHRAGNLRLENNVLKYASRIFVLPPIYEYYKQPQFSDYQCKIEVVEHPLVMERVSQETERNKHSGIKVVYAGSLDQKLRNPSFLLSVMETDRLRNSQIEMVFYSFGNCENLIAESALKTQAIKQMGKINSKTVEEKLAQSDILLTIGNNSDNEIPSKLFEYLSYGKPIIHLYYTEKDKYIEYLSRYPMSICIKMDSMHIEEAAEQMVDFALSMKGKSIDNDVVRRLYKECTPEYVSKQFEEIMQQ